jgi:tRNA(Ile)-lysidine synthase
MADSRKSRFTEPVATAIEACLACHTRKGDHLVVALSGGVDSIVLLHALHRQWPWRLSALHVHHGLQADADAWSDFCGRYCASLDIALRVERVSVERDSRDGLEAAARRARHHCFAGTDGDWLVLAHHRGDRAETLLFNLLRGAGVRGAGAMAQRRGRLLRPLLTASRDDIVVYARAHGLEWMDDPSNADCRFARNFLRHEVMPVLKARFPAADGQLAKAAAIFSEAATLLDDLAISDLGESALGFPVRIELLAGLSEPRARNVLRFLLATAGVDIPSEERLREALRQMLCAAPDRHPAVSFGNWRLLRRRGQVMLERS